MLFKTITFLKYFCFADYSDYTGVPSLMLSTVCVLIKVLVCNNQKLFQNNKMSTDKSLNVFPELKWIYVSRL